MDRLKDKVAVITGGTKGIGLATAQRFIQEGAKVVITSRHAGTEVAASLGQQARWLQQDVTSESDWSRVMQATVAAFGHVDILVNNAGMAIAKGLAEQTLTEWHQVLTTNLDSVMLGTKAGMAAMHDHMGSIVNISSMDGLVGNPLQTAYSAAKGGVNMFTKSAALYAADQGYDIRVNTVLPGGVLTPLVEQIEKKQPGTIAAFTKKYPLKRLGKPAEIANLILFVASDEASFCTGAQFVADGGFTIQ